MPSRPSSLKLLPWRTKELQRKSRANYVVLLRYGGNGRSSIIQFLRLQELALMVRFEFLQSTAIYVLTNFRY